MRRPRGAHAHLRRRRRSPSCGAGAPCSDDAEGNEYLDFITGLAVISLGHAHPAVADAVAEQARTLTHVSNLYGNTLAPEVARTLDRLINGGTGQAGGQVFFANSGAEANECALKLARRWAGGGRHVVVERGELVPRPHPGHPARDRAAREAGPVPASARGVRARALRRPRRARGARSSRTASPPSCSSLSRAREG